MLSFDGLSLIKTDRISTFVTQSQVSMVSSIAREFHAIQLTTLVRPPDLI